MFRFDNDDVAAINVGKYKGVDVGSNIVRIFAMGNFAGYVAISGRYFSLYVNGPLLLRLASLRDTYHRKKARSVFLFAISRSWLPENAHIGKSEVSGNGLASS